MYTNQSVHSHVTRTNSLLNKIKKARYLKAPRLSFIHKVTSLHLYLKRLFTDTNDISFLR